MLVVGADFRATKKAAWLVTMGGAMFLGVACFRGFGWSGLAGLLGVDGWCGFEERLRRRRGVTMGGAVFLGVAC